MEKSFTLNGVEYIETEKGYFYRVEAGKKTRIKKAEYEEAFDALCKTTDEKIDDELFGDLEDEQVNEWMDEIEAGMKKKVEEQAESDKEAEDAVNKKTETKKASKPRKSKDIAHESNGVTLTAKQVDFIKHIPDTCFYEHGLDSIPWCDVLADEIGGQFAGKPMTVGAMISTLREKNLISVGQDRVNGKKCKFFQFTELGKQIAKELGLE